MFVTVSVGCLDERITGQRIVGNVFEILREWCDVIDIDAESVAGITDRLL